jgi:PadR family transcriptional regulator, regulatory protein PadR
MSVLAALCSRPRTWRHGYDLARETGLKSGTLYPILIRLADRGLLESCWEHEQPAGRPRRHLYRLTSEGVARGREVPVELRPLDRAATKRSGPSVRLTRRGRDGRPEPGDHDAGATLGSGCAGRSDASGQRRCGPRQARCPTAGVFPGCSAGCGASPGKPALRVQVAGDRDGGLVGGPPVRLHQSPRSQPRFRSSELRPGMAPG